MPIMGGVTLDMSGIWSSVRAAASDAAQAIDIVALPGYAAGAAALEAGNPNSLVIKAATAAGQDAAKVVGFVWTEAEKILVWAVIAAVVLAVAYKHV